VGITKVKVTKAMSEMPSPPPACDDGPQLNLKGLTGGTSDVDGYEVEDGDDVVADEEEEALQADDGSTQNMKD